MEDNIRIDLRPLAPQEGFCSMGLVGFDLQDYPPRAAFLVLEGV
jgi:hypothetical protein